MATEIGVFLSCEVSLGYLAEGRSIVEVPIVIIDWLASSPFLPPTIRTLTLSTYTTADCPK